MDGPVFQLLYQCTVRLKVLDSIGTGFFVAPGKVLTCAHVVEAAQKNPGLIQLSFNGRELKVLGLNCLPKPYPDLALLSVDVRDHPCAYLDPSVESRDPLYAYGYMREFPGGASVTVEYEGPARIDDEKWLLRFKFGQIIPGYSGSPLLNTHTWRVCGVMKSTRDRATDLGGGGIPTKVVLSELPELAALQEDFFSSDSRWGDATRQQRNSSEVERGPLGDLKEHLLSQVDEIRVMTHLQLGAWGIRGLEQYEAEFPGCSVIPPDSVQQFNSGFAVIDTSNKPRTLALDRFAHEYNCDLLLGPLHLSLVHPRNASLFDKNDHARRNHKSFYVIQPGMPFLDQAVKIVEYEQSAANPYYIDIYFTASLKPDDRQGFRTSKDFDGAEIKAVYTHFWDSETKRPKPPIGSLAPITLRIDIRSEHYALRFRPDLTPAPEEVNERWIAYGVPRAGTFFQSTRQ